MAATMAVNTKSNAHGAKMETLIPNTRTNAAGHLVPESLIDDIDKLRDDTVHNIIRHAQALQAQMQQFKVQTFADIETFMQISAEQYNTTWGGKKGNVSLVSYDGRYKVQLSVADRIAFGEQLQIAKQLVDECIHSWTNGSNDRVRVLIEHAFQTDKQGKINTARVLNLMSLKIDDDDNWTMAMQALRDSINVVATAKYIRIYERIGKSDQYRQLSLDMSGIVVDDDIEAAA
jgi:hypothetical protein